jgi:hypothetical protein
MATAETCDLSPSHPPKPASINTFKQLLPVIKRQLIHLRHTHDAHEPEYFQSVSTLSDNDLADFSEDDLVAIRAGNVAYGLLVFGKVRIPAKAKVPGALGQYFFVRWFVGGSPDGDGDGDGDVDKEVKFHSIYTEEKDDGEGRKRFRAIMSEDDVIMRLSELRSGVLTIYVGAVLFQRVGSILRCSRGILKQGVSGSEKLDSMQQQSQLRPLSHYDGLPSYDNKNIVQYQKEINTSRPILIPPHNLIPFSARLPMSPH